MTDGEKIVKIIDQLKDTEQHDMTNAELNILIIATGSKVSLVGGF